MVAFWFPVALSAALLKTGYSILQKHLTSEYDGLELSYITSVLGLLFMTPIGGWYFSRADLHLTSSVILVTVIAGVANIGAIGAFLLALEREDLSIVSPLRQTNPIVVVIIEPVLLGGQYKGGVVLAAAAVVAGTYLLLRDTSEGPLSIRRAGATPALLALTAAVLFAITAIASRFVVTRIPPLFYGFSIYAFMALGFSVLRLARDQTVPIEDLFQGRLLLLGGLTSLRTSVAFIAFSLATASRVSIVLQISVLLNILVGGVLFTEGHILRKLLGGLFIVSGVVLTL